MFSVQFYNDTLFVQEIYENWLFILKGQAVKWMLSQDRKNYKIDIENR